ncbi:DUF29 family protein [Rhodovulum bhavnagarense]|nr:DUF29 family protein [Rhodovulum bhavnagarense]
MADGAMYQEDFLAWTIDQANRLRAISQFQLEEFDGVDFDLLIEEVEDLGRSDVLRVQSLVRKALVHLIKIVSDPDADAVNHWEREVMTFTLDASDSYGGSYRQRIDMDAVWKKAQREAALALGQHGSSPKSFESSCPVDLDWMMGDEFTVEAARNQISSAVIRPPEP